jgi:hypothetical protein
VTAEAKETSPNGTTVRAGLAGAGGGTSLLLLAESLPPGSLRSVALYVAPSASVIIGSIFFYVEIQAKRYLQQRLVKRLRRTLEEYLQNPLTSEEHKVALRKRLELVEQTVTLQEVERIRVIGILPAHEQADLKAGEPA